MPQRSVPLPIPAPSGGINTRDGLQTLAPNEARDMENWNPIGNAVEIRTGHTSWSTGGVASNPVETLAGFHGLTSSKLVGIGGGDITDYTSSSASEISNSNYTESRWQHEVYNNRLLAVNGTDTPFVYDGSSAGATGWSGSGLTIANLINIAKVRTRLWFCEKNVADVWYGGVGSITGTLTKFQLSQVVGGGVCMAIGSHSQDAGDGPDDYTVFVMSTGEIVIYSGDPGSTFAKIGNFKMPPPIGRKCLINIGGQLAVITHMGLVPLSAAISGIAFDPKAIGNFGKIAPSIQRDADLYGTLEGWEGVFFDGYVIINVPTLSNQTSRQWVYNTLTGAWTKWTNLSVASMAVLDGILYFGSWATGTVYKLTGVTDNSSAIAFKARSAFVALNNNNRFQASAIRFDMTVEGGVTAQFGLDTDGIERPITAPAETIGEAAASTPWGSAWGSPWSTTDQYQGQWFSAFADGRSVGLAIQGSANITRLQWTGSQILVQPGGPL